MNDVSKLKKEYLVNENKRVLDLTNQITALQATFMKLDRLKQFREIHDIIPVIGEYFQRTIALGNVDWSERYSKREMNVIYQELAPLCITLMNRVLDMLPDFVDSPEGELLI